MAAEAKRLKCKLILVDEFIEKVFIPAAYRNGATIVGFNLPFDLSRIAISFQRSGPVYPRKADKPSPEVPIRKEKIDRSMVGGFTFKLSNHEDRPNLRVKHLSRRAAFINFAYAGEQPTARSRRKRKQPTARERGFFLDLKTLAAALTSKSHSLDSLAEFLEVPRKTPFQDFGREIDAEFIGYAMNDVEVTWQCYRGLMSRFEQHELTQTLPHKIYSEAGLGKAYLREMGIRPWRQMQPDFDQSIIGAIMSSYLDRPRSCSPQLLRPLTMRVEEADHHGGLRAIKRQFIAVSNEHKPIPTSMRESALTGLRKTGFGSEPDRPKAEAGFATRSCVNTHPQNNHRPMRGQ